MKKLLPSLAVITCLGMGSLAQAQGPVPYTMPFDSLNQAYADGWIDYNVSGPQPGLVDWFTGNPNVFPGHSGGYVGANFNSVGGSGTISNWLFAPAILMENGDQFTFYTRANGDYADRLQVRLADLNDPNFSVPVTPTDTGSWTTLLLDINPTYDTSLYPTSWQQYTVTISGLTNPTLGIIAFRYFVENGGPSGTNSDYMGLDEFVYTKAACNTFTFFPAGSNLVSAAVGVAYADTISSPDFSITGVYTIESGSLPAGLTLNGNGTISGTPTAAGSDTFTVRLTDVFDCTTDKQYVIVTSCPTITGSGIGNGWVNTAYTDTIVALGGVAPYTYSISSGTLPTGLTLDPNTGVISGTPTVTSSSTIDFLITDSIGCTGIYGVLLAINCDSITIDPLTTGTVYASYTDTITVNATGGTSVPPYTYTIVSGSFPNGISIDPSTGIISGTPTEVGNFSLVIDVVDVNSCASTVNASIAINCDTITLSTGLSNGAVGATYTDTVTVTSGSGTYTFAVASGTLPSGLTLDPSTGIISGTADSSQTETFTISATDNATSCNASESYTVVITCPAIGTDTVTLAPFAAVCVSGAPITLTGGSPAGGVYSGTGVSSDSIFDPAVAGAGTTVITYTVTETSGCSYSATDSITVTAVPTVALNLGLSIHCISAGNLTLTGGTPAGGTYSGTGVSNGVLDPSVAGAGDVVVTYTYTDSVTTCIGTATDTVTISTCTGLENNDGLSFVVYPNPAQDFITIAGTTLATENTVIEVISLDGKLVKQVVLGNGITQVQHSMNVSRLTPGVYFIKLNNGKVSTVEKFIKF